MLHSFVSWDCSFRNFFHLVHGLAEQDFDKDQFELIYVQQRSKEHADAYNHAFGLKSLSDLEEEYKDQINFKVLYLDQPETSVYNLGVANNAGIEAAQGEYISVMDGDMLLHPQFLNVLTEFHEKHKGLGVANVFRHMCEYPVGVSSYSDWDKGIVDLKRCLKACETRLIQTPRTVGNMGPLVSAHKDHWYVIEGYASEPLWATSASIAGGDANARLEMVTGQKSLALQNVYGVHPWHPLGYARQGRTDKKQLVLNYMSLQKQLLAAARDNNWFKHSDRKAVYERIMSDPNHQKIIENVHAEERLDFEAGGIIPNKQRYQLFKKKYSTAIAPYTKHKAALPVVKKTRKAISLVQERYVLPTLRKMTRKELNIANPPIFIVGLQGGGLTLVSRIFRRHKDVVSINGNNRFWSAGDEMQNECAKNLPEDFRLFHCQYFNQYPFQRGGWMYGTNDYVDHFIKGEDDYSEKDAKVFTSVIEGMIRRYASNTSTARFIDKSQSYGLKMPLFRRIFAQQGVKFLVMTRNPYIAIVKSAKKPALSTLHDKSEDEVLELAAQHYSNCMREMVKNASDQDTYMIQFEDFLQKPKEHISNICDFMGLSFDEDMLPAPHHEAEHKWYPIRPSINQDTYKNLTQKQIDVVNRYCDDLFEPLGYEKIKSQKKKAAV